MGNGNWEIVYNRGYYSTRIESIQLIFKFGLQAGPEPATSPPVSPHKTEQLPVHGEAPGACPGSPEWNHLDRILLEPVILWFTLLIYKSVEASGLFQTIA